MSTLQEQDRLGHACCESGADPSSAHGDSTVVAGVDPDELQCVEHSVGDLLPLKPESICAGLVSLGSRACRSLITLPVSECQEL